MHCDVEWQQPVWNETASRKHRKAGPRSRKLWERSILAATTAGGEPAIYDPNLTRDQISEMEMECVRVRPNGTTLGIELPQILCHVRTFYQNFDIEIGACDGTKTTYMFVQQNHDGSVHGYPVTESHLRDRGANL